MTYRQIEDSTQEAKPIEVYKFSGSYQNYYYTSYLKDVTVKGQLYTAISITRNGLSVGTQEDSQQILEVTMPFSERVVKDYVAETSPPSLSLEILRVHESDMLDSVSLWNGKVTSIDIADGIAKIAVPSIFSYILSGTTPPVRYQSPCNHVLYDSRCGVSELLFKETRTVTQILDNIVTVNDLTQVPDTLRAGMMRVNSTGEARMIISTQGFDIRVTYPFSNINIGDGVDILQGCDHTFETCRTKFSNGHRYGGHPLVPKRNPFGGRI